MWVWCSLNLFACSRIPVLKEPVLLLLSRMTRTTTPFVRKVTSPNINKVLLTLSFQKFLQQSLKLWPSLLNMCWNMLVVCTSFYLALLSKNMFCMRIFTENLAYFDIFLCLCKVSGQNIRLKVIFQRVKKNGQYFCVFLFGAWPFSSESMLTSSILLSAIE